MKKLLIGILVALFLSLSSAALAYQVYIKRSDNTVVRTIGAILPVAKLGWHTISYGQFLESRDTLKTYLASPAAKLQQQTAEYTPTLERQATVDRLLRDAAIQEYADAHQIMVKDEEVREQFTSMVNTASSTGNVSQFLADNFNWTEEQFRANIVRPMMIESKVAATFSTSTPQNLEQLQSYLADRLKKDDVKVYLKF